MQRVLKKLKLGFIIFGALIFSMFVPALLSVIVFIFREATERKSLKNN